MNAKSQNSAQPWIDPDDAPELTDDFFEQGDWKIGERPVSLEEGGGALQVALSPDPVGSPEVALTLRYEAEVVEAFKATGKGWQSRMNAALREWIKSYPG